MQKNIKKTEVVKEQADNVTLPKGWALAKVSDVAELFRGINYRKEDSSSVPFKNSIPILRANNINGELNFDDLVFVPRELVKEEQYVKKGDIVFAMSSGSKHLVGKSAVANNDFEGSYGAFCALLRVSDKVNKKYISYIFKGDAYRRLISDIAKGTNINNLKREHILNFQFPLPPRPIQDIIVSKIEELFSEIDKGFEYLRLAQQQLKTYRQAVLKWAFEGRLTNENVKDGELPEGWTWVKTGEVINIINNGYTPTKEYLSDGAGEVPFIKVYNLNFNGTLNFEKNPTFIPRVKHIKDLKRSICIPGDVLINIVGPPLGKVSIVTNQYPEWNINQAIVMFRPNSLVTTKYISYYMQNPTTINWLENTSKATAGQWNVKVSTCREIPIPICSVIEQNKIVEEIEKRLSVADKLELVLAESFFKTESLKQASLKRAFVGDLK